MIGDCGFSFSVPRSSDVHSVDLQSSGEQNQDLNTHDSTKSESGQKRWNGKSCSLHDNRHNLDQLPNWPIRSTSISVAWSTSSHVERQKLAVCQTPRQTVHFHVKYLPLLAQQCAKIQRTSILWLLRFSDELLNWQSKSNVDEKCQFKRHIYFLPILPPLLQQSYVLPHSWLVPNSEKQVLLWNISIFYFKCIKIRAFSINW